MSDKGRDFPNLDKWQTSIDCSRGGLELTPAKFLEVTDLLLENPNLNSSHLFRADILFDSANILKTVAEKEKLCNNSQAEGHGPANGTLDAGDYNHDPQGILDGATPDRVVIRRLIPRNSNLDRALDQKCLVYHHQLQGFATAYAVVYLPRARDEADIPWYHPPVKGLAYLYRNKAQGFQPTDGQANLSLYFLPFNDPPDRTPERLHRTFISLLNTFIRLSKNSSPPTTNPSTSEDPTFRSTAPSALKDTIIPQHLVQNTYSRLKQTYASDLIARWVESTEPSKHVFEDLSIAAFLIELWKLMYRDRPCLRFVDVACGNGVLVYILLKEGYQGWGFDARRRKTWDILGIDNNVEKRICIPRPFVTALDLTVENALPGVKVHNGIFPKETFIISNHADELTPWTPLLAAMSSPEDPLPFLAIPCCSHALSGVKHRYTPKDSYLPTDTLRTDHSPSNGTTTSVDDAEPQPSAGDLKSLRSRKAKAASHTDDKSMYACLTKKVVALAEEVGFDVEMTLMRIPSTRNIGVVGGRRMEQSLEKAIQNDLDSKSWEMGREKELFLEEHACVLGKAEKMLDKVQWIIERECARSGGIEASARTWIERSRELQTGKGRGKVNLGRRPDVQDN